MIKFENICLNFGDKKIFENFSLDIIKGEKILLSGRSGTGKSTLLKIILGFENNYTGNIYFEEKKIDKKNIWNIRGMTSYVSQNLDIGEGTLSKFIENIFLLKSNRNKKYPEEEIDKYFKAFELKKEILNKNIEELSGGERQRAAIVISLLLGRKIFKLDEVTSALDIKSKEKVIDFFIENKDFTVIAVSHDEAWKKEGVRMVEIR